MEDTEMEDTEDGTGQPLCPINDLVDPFADFDAYEYLSMADDEDLEDLEAIRIIFSQNKRSRSIKFKHDRKDWDSHVRMLLATNEFENRFRMSKDHFDILLEAIREGITVVLTLDELYGRKRSYISRDSHGHGFTIPWTWQ